MFFCNSVKQIEKATMAKILAKRLYENNYIENALFPVTKVYGEPKTLPTNQENKVSLCKIMSIQENEARTRAIRIAKYIRRNDRKLLFQTLNKYIDEWWE